MKDLIINADDFGMSPEVNAGIKKGVEAGIINNVSLMVNLPHFDEAVDFLRHHPEASVGLHFNITEGKSVLAPAQVGSLLKEDDSFHHWTSLVPRIFFRDAKVSDVQKELGAQYERLRATGLPITHIDSHHHIHLYPSIFQIVTRFADQKQVPSLRSHHFKLWSLNVGIGKRPTAKQLLINSLLWFDSFFYNHRHLGEVDGIYDLNWKRDLPEDELLKILDHLPDGKTEIICHLAILSETGNRKFLEPRFNKLKLLSRESIRERLAKNGVNLFKRETNV